MQEEKKRQARKKRKSKAEDNKEREEEREEGVASVALASATTCFSSVREDEDLRPHMRGLRAHREALRRRMRG